MRSKVFEKLVLIAIWVSVGTVILAYTLGKPLTIPLYVVIALHAAIPSIALVSRQKRHIRRLRDLQSEYMFQLEMVQDEVNSLKGLSNEVEQLRRLRKPAGSFDRFNNDLTTRIDGELNEDFRQAQG